MCYLSAQCEPSRCERGVVDMLGVQPRTHDSRASGHTSGVEEEAGVHERMNEYLICLLLYKQGV